MNSIVYGLARRGLLASAIAALALFPSCEKEADGVVDPSLVRPFVLAGSVSPDSLVTSLLPESNGMISASLTVRASISIPSNSQSLESVIAEFLDPTTGESLASISLHDDGLSPDSSANDLRFSGLFQISLPKFVVGRYPVRISTTTAAGTGSNYIEKSALFVRESHVPALSNTILSNLVVPDTIFVPADGTTDFTAKISAADPQGPSDIAQVFFVNLDSTDPTRRFTLYDDGSVHSSSGDAVAGDGVYTITVTAPASAKGRSYRWRFQATDAIGDTSASLLHFLTIK